MAEGRLFIGQQAREIGLVDEIGNFETALATARKAGFESWFYGKTLTGALSPTREEGDIMPNEKVTLEKLEAEAPGLLKDIRQAAMDGVDPEPARKEGATAEREKIIALAKVHFGEAETGKFEALVNSGATVEMYQAMKEAMPQPAEPKGAGKTEKMDTMLAAIQGAGAENPGAGSHVSGPGNFTEAWKAIKDEKGCTTEAAMKEAVKKYPDLHKAFISQPAGNA